MGEADESRISGSSRMTRNLSLQLDKYPADLVHRFMSSAHRSDYKTPDEETEELELSLGLSLGGRFGVDRSCKSKLIRSSSIAGLPLGGSPTGEDSPQGSYPPLMRTASLPTETEEEWRKRKELQTLRRLAAKRRRSEKQRKAEKEGGGGGGGGGGGEEAGASGRSSNTVAPPFGVPSWAQAVLGSGGKGKDGVLGGGGGGGGSGGLGFRQQTSDGSTRSHEGSLESDSRPKQGSVSCSARRSPTSHQLLQDHTNTENDPAGSSSTKIIESSVSPSKKPELVENRGKEVGMSSMEDMPCVITKGDGPNGRRIEGILYKYGKGEDVRIMCVCHGSFLSPAEFVKHAGGGDVAHPLRHIVINPNPTFTR